jgi:cell division protein FtsA
MREDDFVVGLDLGTTKICAVVGQYVQSSTAHAAAGTVSAEDSFKVLAVGRAPSMGIKKGVVVNIEDTVEGIKKAVKEAELMAGVTIRRAIVGVGGAHIKGQNSTGVVGIKGKEVEASDISRVIDAARAVAIPPDRSALHVLPQEFKVDDQDGIRDPMGMMGTRLESRVHIVTAALSAIQNIVRCCEKTGLAVGELVLQPLASSRAILSKDEMELGVALVDIGGGTTDMAIFHNGCLIHTAVIPVGGSHITQDLAIGLRTPHNEAERIKIAQGCALKQMISAHETIEVPSVGGRPARIVDRKLLGEIIEPRLEEILQLVNREIIASGCADLLGGGVVLTGGSTLLNGITELGEFVFDLPVKRAAPERVVGFSDMVADPAYSTGVGLALWGLSKHQNQEKKSQMRNVSFGRVSDSVRSWFADMF